ncbi:MAG: YchJ family protein [Waterburya sp.]
MPQNLCPCGSKKAAKYCCQMYLSGQKQPETAEKLMRSRYTAFCQGNVDYLIATLHPERRKPNERVELINSIKNTQWLGLKIIDTEKGKKNEKIGYVEFEAIYQITEPKQLHERSEFVKIVGQWFYVTGEILPGTIPQDKQPCWCFSGKTFHKCHGK